MTDRLTLLFRTMQFCPVCGTKLRAVAGVKNVKECLKGCGTAYSSDDCESYETICFHPDEVVYAQKPTRIKVVETGDIYDTMKLCAEGIGGQASGICQYLKGYRSHHKGYRFERVV